MLRWMRAFGALGLLSAVSAVSFGGCVEAEARFYIEKMVPPEVEDGVAKCPAESEDLLKRADAVCDASGCAGIACLVVRNGIVSSLESSASNNKVETSDIQIYRMDLSYAWSGGAHEETVNVMSFVDAGNSDEPGLSGYGLEVFTPTAASEFISSTASGTSVDLVIGVTLFGRTTGGLEVESPEAFVPVTVDRL